MNSMRWSRPKPLGKTVEAKATNRPLKIVYLVPFDDAIQTHMNLDAVFFEAYTRWAGVYTIIVPTLTHGFMLNEYEAWLKKYDPDFIYSYVDLDQDFVDRIDRICCPIGFVKHTPLHKATDVQWRYFLPIWDSYIKPVSSITNVLSPNYFNNASFEDRPKEPLIFTQFGMEPSSRFLADNFGTGFNTQNITNPIPGYFKTLCLIPPNLPKHMFGGSENCTTVLEAFRAISDYKATPISCLAMINSDGIPRVSSIAWSSAFRLFIGTTAIDRIDFWNSRHLGDIWNDRSNALIVDPSMFDDADFVKQLGQHLNKHNFLSSGNGPNQVVIHSSSLTLECLESLKVKLQPHTWSQIALSKKLDSHAIPSEQDIAKRVHYSSNDTTTLKLTEDVNDIVAKEPDYFVYIPAQFKGLAKGQWIVELGIERHENLSKFSNVIDTWTLPRRKKITRAFTDRLAKPTAQGRLALIPSSESSVFLLSRKAISTPVSYEIRLPTDEIFFRHLSLNFYEHPSDDVRASLPKLGYQELSVSDKGQNLRGVISLFEDLSTAFEIATNKYWRTVFRMMKQDSIRPLTFDLDKFLSLIPNDRPTIKQFTELLHLPNHGATKLYFENSLKDTLEYLVRSNVFYQVEHWRCEYCGHVNSRSFDNMKIKNECDICSTQYFAALDIKWKYELNNFVFRSLIKHSGLPVLWTLGYLQSHNHILPDGSFWYLPEVDLFEKLDDSDSKNEIDILCIINGVFHMVEVKLSASLFINKSNEQKKFLKLIEQLRPDVAILSFERYCSEGDDADEIKAKLNSATQLIGKQISPWTKLEVIVAEDFDDFNTFPTHIGWHGQRMRAL